MARRIASGTTPVLADDQTRVPYTLERDDCEKRRQGIVNANPFRRGNALPSSTTDDRATSHDPTGVLHSSERSYEYDR